VSSRRTFLKTAAIAGIATAVTPVSLLAAKSKRNDFSVPDNEKHLTFLFQGDSITDGNRGRSSDPNHIMGHGYAFAVASRVGADFPHAGFSFYNRGISGNSVPDLQQRWKTDTLDLHPDVLSLLVGINDTDFAIRKNESITDVAAFDQGYRDLLQQSKVANPKTLFVLGLPFVYPVGKRKINWEKWRDGVAARKAVVLKLAAEFNAITVDYPSVFDRAMQSTPADYWIWDGIHPTVFGHELMAREWIRQLSSRLNFLKQYHYK
jgi:lysophospholipase L1-like esterase